MFEPKFKIGDIVQAKEFGIERATVVGVRIYYESHNIIDRSINSVGDYVEKTNNCDYEIAYGNEDNTFEIDNYSETFLELLSN